MTPPAEAIHARLRRAFGPAVSANGAPPPPDLRDRLRRAFGAGEGRRGGPRPPIAALRESRLAIEERHGNVPLAEVSAVDPSRLAEAGRAPGLERSDLRRLVFFDTETTALGGGAGVLVFLAGIARVEGAAFAVRQHFLRGPGEERPFLEAVAREFEGADGVVTFAGKAFDRHRLEDRLRFHGMPVVFDPERHLDLLHPFRRLARGLPDHRLRTLEERLLGLRRVDDLPGSEAPRAYFEYLAGRGGAIARVFEHNRLDLLSLVALTALLGERTDGPPRPLAQRLCRFANAAILPPA